MASENDNSAETEKFEVTGPEATLVMAIMEHMHPNFNVQGWEAIAAKVGLSVATAKQRFGAIKNRYKDVNDGVIPAVPIVKKRKRGAAHTGANAGEVEGCESVPARPVPKKGRRATAAGAEVKVVNDSPSAPIPVGRGSMAGSRTRVRVLDEEDIIEDGDDVPRKRGGSKDKDEIEEAARTLLAMRYSNSTE